MQVLEFLSAISTPKVQTKSLYNALCSTSLHQKDYEIKKKIINIPKKYKYYSSRTNPKFSQHNQSLSTTSPYYLSKRNPLTRNVNVSCHTRKLIADDNETRYTNYLKKGLGTETAGQYRKNASKLKRQYLRNFQRNTYQPRDIKFNSINDQNFRKQLANIYVNHKFCNFFSLKCQGGKCKLDCINQKFEQFLKEADLCILKGLNKIQGRGKILQSQIKTQIMSLLIQNKLNLTMQQLNNKIKQKFKDKINKSLLSKYCNWANQMHKVLVKIQTRRRKRQINLQNFTQNLNFEKAKQKQNLQFFNQKLVKNQRQKVFQWNDRKKKSNEKFNKISKFKKTNKQKKNYQQQDYEQNQQKVRQQIFSIRGSRVGSQRNSKQIFSSRNSLQNGEFYGMIQTKYKSKKMKYQNRHSKNKACRINTQNSNQKQNIEKEVTQFTSCKESQQQNNKIQNNVQSADLFQDIENSSDHSLVIARLEDFEKLLSRRQNVVKKNSKFSSKLLPKLSKQQQKAKSSTQNFNVFSNLRKKYDKANSSKKVKLIRRQNSIIARRQNWLNNQNNDSPLSKKNFNILKTEKSIRSKKKVKTFIKSPSEIQQGQQNPQKDNGVEQQEEDKKIDDVQNNTSVKQDIKHILKQIGESSNIIGKVQQSLQKAGLQKSIINQSDSYLTQKRKVTHIRQNIKSGFLQNMSQQVQKYLELIISRKLKGFYSYLQQRRKTKKRTQKLQKIEQQQIENEIQRLINKQKQLKFYRLQKQHYTKDPFEVAHQQTQKQQIQLKVCEKQGKQLIKNRQFLYRLESYVTEKQRKPFDYYHFLEMGNTIINNFKQQRHYEKQKVKKQSNQDLITTNQSLVIVQKQMSKERRVNDIQP